MEIKFKFIRHTEEDCIYKNRNLYAYIASLYGDTYLVYSVVENPNDMTMEDLIILVDYDLRIFSFNDIIAEYSTVEEAMLDNNLHFISFCSYKQDLRAGDYYSNTNFTGLSSVLTYGDEVESVRIGYIDDVPELQITWASGPTDRFSRFESRDINGLYCWGDELFYTTKLENITPDDLYKLHSSWYQTSHKRILYKVANREDTGIGTVPYPFLMIRLSNLYDEYPDMSSTIKITKTKAVGDIDRYFEGLNLNAWQLKYDLRPTSEKYNWCPEEGGAYGTAHVDVCNREESWCDDSYYKCPVWSTTQLELHLLEFVEWAQTVWEEIYTVPDFSALDPNALWLCAAFINPEGVYDISGAWLLASDIIPEQDNWQEALGYNESNWNTFAALVVEIDDSDVGNFVIRSGFNSPSDVNMYPDYIYEYSKLTVAADYKGIIYYMKDERGNEAPYDFKNMIYTNGGGHKPGPNIARLSLLKETEFPDYFSEGNVYTFTGADVTDASLDLNAHDNIIKPCRVGNTYVLPLNFIINRSNSAMCSNYFGYDAHSNVLLLFNVTSGESGGDGVPTIAPMSEGGEVSTLSINPDVDTMMENDQLPKYEISNNYIGNSCNRNFLFAWNFILDITIDRKASSNYISHIPWDQPSDSIGLANIVFYKSDINEEGDLDWMYRGFPHDSPCPLWYISPYQTEPLDIFETIMNSTPETTSIDYLTDSADESNNYIADASELRKVALVSASTFNDLNTRLLVLEEYIRTLQQS